MYTPVVYSGIMALTLYIYMMHRINCLKKKKKKHQESHRAQGSVLGPYIYSFVYINDIPDNITSTVIDSADNTIMYIALKHKTNNCKIFTNLINGQTKLSLIPNTCFMGKYLKLSHRQIILV